MSIKIMNAVWSSLQPTNPSARLILLALADWSNESGYSWPKIRTIANKTLCSERTVQRAIRDMTTKGFIQKSFELPKCDPNNSAFGKKYHLYRININALRIAPKKLVRGDKLTPQKVPN